MNIWTSQIAGPKARLFFDNADGVYRATSEKGVTRVFLAEGSQMFHLPQLERWGISTAVARSKTW